jgi:hypothetical protein
VECYALFGPAVFFIARVSLVLLLPSRMLPPGVYQLTIEGVKVGDQRVVVAAYPFRVVRSLADKVA